MRKATRMAAAGLGVTSLMAISACGGGGDNGGGGDADANAWILTGGGWPAIEEDFNRWNESNEDAQIDVEGIENDSYKGQIRTAVGSGEAPTLIMSWTGGALLEYAEQDAVVDLTGETGDLEERVFDSVWQNGQVEDSTYAVPLNDVQPVVMYYNQEVFDEAGVEIPETWEDVEAAIETFNENDVAPFSLAGGSVWPALMWLQYLTDRHGGEEVFQAVVEGEEGAWDNESILFALETMQDLGENGGFIDSYNSVTADQNEDAQLLADGQAAMLLQAPGSMPPSTTTSQSSLIRATSASPPSPHWKTERETPRTSWATQPTSGRSRLMLRKKSSRSPWTTSARTSTTRRPWMRCSRPVRCRRSMTSKRRSLPPRTRTSSSSPASWSVTPTTSSSPGTRLLLLRWLSR